MNPRLAQALFPAKPRFFHGERWVNIMLRCAHLVGVAGIGSGFLFDRPPTGWEGYWYLTLGSGIALSGLYLWGTLAWLLELKGMVVMLKTALLAVALGLPALRAELFVLVIVLSGMIAHAPARIRGYRWLRAGEVTNRR